VTDSTGLAADAALAARELTRLRPVAGAAWAFRARVEREAELRFGRLAAAIAAFDPASPVPQLLRKAQGDERRHALLCAALARSFGAEPGAGADDRCIAPASLGPREAAVYEMVAACCITETESVSTVTTLLAADAEPAVRETLHEIARDEISHSRMGWAHLAREAALRPVGFLSPLVPVMLAGTVSEDFFAPAAAGRDDDLLLRLGVLPHVKKQEVFLGTLREVVLPGLERHGVDPGPALRWLDARAAPTSAQR
jgi:rubrerythrin